MFDFLPLSSILLSVVGGLLSILVHSLELSRRAARARKGPSFRALEAKQIDANFGAQLLRQLAAVRLQAGQVVLLGFAVVVSAFGIFTAWKYWPQIATNQDSVLYVTWLFITMVAGMFVQVLSSHYRAGRPFFDVSASQLIYPLLFALVVFYPVWAIGASAPHNLFSFYAAFLNGFFWETVVANARLPTPPAGSSAESRRAG